jgi:hypothetical protein
MTDNLKLHGVQVLTELLQEPLEKARALKGEIEKRQALVDERDHLRGVLDKIKALLIELQKEVDAAIEINNLKGEIKPIIKSLGDDELIDEYNEFAGGALEVFRVTMPDELAVYETGMSFQEVRQRISQLNSQLAKKEQK